MWDVDCRLHDHAVHVLVHAWKRTCVRAGVSLYGLVRVCAQDGPASDSMDAACDAMHLNGLVRKAIGFIRGMDVKLSAPAPAAAANSPELSASHFEMAIFSVLPLLKVREKFALCGEPAQFNRRDMRSGEYFVRPYHLCTHMACMRHGDGML